MASQDRFAGLDIFLGSRGDHLLHEAILLTGGRGSGEELLQDALVRLLERWDKIEGDPEGYLRRILYHLAVDRWRRPVRRREILVAELPEREADEGSGWDLGSQLVDALRLLSRHQRAVIVLRYFVDASEAETAAILGCPIGTVKSASSRGLARLRKLAQNASAEEASRTLQKSFTD